MAYNSVNFRLIKVNLTNNTGIVLDLIDKFKTIEIFESINDTFITGYVVISDANNFLESMKLKGDETITIEFSDNPLNYASKSGISDSYTFDVYKIENVSYESAHSKSYTIRFISQSYFKNISNRIRKSYDKKGCILTNDIVTKLLESKLDKITECKYDEHLIFPNVFPSKAVKMISAISTTDIYGSDFLFYETKTGFNFVTSDWLIQQEPVDSLNDYLVTTYTEDVQPYKIEEHKNVFKTDAVVNSTSGAYGSTAIYHNLINKEVSEKSFTYEESYSEFKHTGSAKLTDKHNYPKGQMKYAPTYSTEETSYKNTSEWYHKNLTRRNQFNNNFISIIVNGNDKLKAGDMLFANFSDSGKTSISRHKDSMDSGKYLIINLRRVITPNKYSIALDLAGDSHNA